MTFTPRTRDEILRRSKTLWPEKGIAYSQSAMRVNTQGAKYRTDCSGYLSMCWGVPTTGPGTWGGYSTVTLVSQHVMKEIPFAALKPGDAIGECGPDTDGDGGHIMLWLSGGKSHYATALVRDFGYTPGWREHYITIPGQYKAYRFVSVVEIAPIVSARHLPSSILRIHSQGLDVRVLQSKLGGLKVDGYFGPLTRAKVLEFQRKHGLEVDGIVGPKTWAALYRSTT